MKSADLSALFGPLVVDERGGGAIATSIPASELDFYASCLLPLGTEVRVESPPQLIAAIRQRARVIARMYDDEEPLCPP